MPTMRSSVTTISRLRTLRGRVLAPDCTSRRFVDWADAAIDIDADGRITALRRAEQGSTTPETWPGSVILPGFVDAHLHFPQTRIIGSASGPLLEWLEASVFPEEARFADAAYAAAVAEEFCDHLIAQGTTCAAVYGSTHPAATRGLLETLERRGLRAFCGLTLMDREAPAELKLEAGAALSAVRELCDRFHGRDGGRLSVSVNPRFAISCTPALLRGAGELASTRDLIVQTHVSENRDEIAHTASLFPTHPDYLAVYEAHACASPRTVLAHCIHFSEDEWDRVQAQDLAVAHCPDSNFFLGSGCMPLRSALERGVRVGLGSDVGAGRTFSMRRVAAAAYDASLLREAPVSPEELLWLATRGGSRALSQGQQVGCIEPGFDADLVVIDAPSLPTKQLIDALLFRHDAGPVRATIVRGRVLGSS